MVRSPLLSRAATTSARCFQKGYLVRSYHAWNLFPILSMCSSNVHLADTRPHSPTTLAYDPHKNHRKYPNYAPTCVYRFFDFRAAIPPCSESPRITFAVTLSCHYLSIFRLGCPKRQKWPIYSVMLNLHQLGWTSQPARTQLPSS